MFNAKKIERVSAPALPLAAVGVAPFIASDAIPSFTGVADEYNPLVPNEYDDLVKKKKEEKERDRKRDAEERLACHFACHCTCLPKSLVCGKYFLCHCKF